MPFEELAVRKPGALMPEFVSRNEVLEVLSIVAAVASVILAVEKKHKAPPLLWVTRHLIVAPMIPGDRVVADAQVRAAGTGVRYAPIDHIQGEGATAIANGVRVRTK